MPKETIHWGPKYIYDVTRETGPTSWREKLSYDPEETRVISSNMQVSREPNLEVLWGKPIIEHTPYNEDPAGYVQIGLNVDIFDLQDIAKVLERNDGETATTVLTRSLSRAQINNMIKVLKRARDAAYGADE